MLGLTPCRKLKHADITFDLLQDNRVSEIQFDYEDEDDEED